MSISEAPPSPSDDRPSSINYFSPSRAKCSIRSLVPHFKAKRSISKPKPKPKLKPNPKSLEDNDHNAASSRGITNNIDDHGGAPALYKLIDQDLISMREYVDHVNLQINHAHEKLQQLKTRGSSETELDELKNLKKVVAKLKSQIPSQDKVHSVDSNLHRNSWPDINKPRDEMMPNLYNKEPKFEHIIELQELKRALNRLPFEVRFCLFHFFMFPPMSVIERRFLIYWWIANGLVTCHKSGNNIEEKSDEDVGNKIFDMLIAEGFIEPIYQKCSLTPDSGRMSPYVHSVVTNETKAYLSSLFIALGQDNQCHSPLMYSYVINVGESIIDGGPQIFETMGDIRILYLGRWQSSATHHIEVADTQILYGLRNMRNLTFLSLRGISLITELPSFVSELTCLKILDLKACHNLEVIPDRIGSLQWLTHLDMSECYFLENMPKSLANLSCLEVLKGFFIGDSKYNKWSCTLNDLSGLPKLRKLNIYTSVKDFPTERHLRAFEKFTALQKLTISWGGCSSLSDNDASKQAKDDAIESSASGLKHPGIKGHVTNKEDTTREAPTQPDTFPKRLRTLQSDKHFPALPSTLQKLDLQCFRGTSPPSWLRPANLKQLKKLYLRGGQFCDLGQFQKHNEEDQWKVEILRLKYLSELEIHWQELKILFPKLIYLHKVDCPKLINFPFDESVGWVDLTKEASSPN